MRLTVWINVFIPLEVAGYTRLIQRGLHAGKTAVPLPGVARANPMNLFKDLDAGYLTDQRVFSTSVHASHRMQSLIVFQLNRVPTILRTNHHSSGTTEVDMDTGEELGFKAANMSRCSFSPLTRLQQPAGVRRGTTLHRVPFGGSFTLNHPTSDLAPHPIYRTRVTAAAGDPLVSLAADIDYEGVFELRLDPTRPIKCDISFEGHIDEFPAYECYAELNGVTKTLFQSVPPIGNTVTDLLGGANREIRGIASF